MKIDIPTVRRLLKECDFRTLFREHLGWDNFTAKLDIPIDGNTHSLAAIAEKRGFQVYVSPTIPDRPTRLKLDRQITKSAREHLVIYIAPDRKEQIWEWVRREQGKPAASRDYRFYVSQSGDELIQKLEGIAVELNEEERLTLPDVAGRVRAALDVDKITKKFYERFKAEHTAFMKFIKGIRHDADLQWYTSLMLNRLMFVYFIQKKGFLDGDTEYLRNRLARMRQQYGKDKFYSFYRYFLLRLFHEGLGQAPKERMAELDRLLGKVPFLNGGFFEVHDLEEKYTTIEIPDAAFEKLFEFFEAYRWHLDERPLKEGNEINPDVVGYIFEKYVNQKQMGAYYTKEDITEYISKNTIIPFLFDAADKKCAIAFKPESALWRMLRDDPDRYIYAAVRHGVVTDKGDIIPLPAEIETGVADVSKRGGWNKPAPQPFALPTETWREHVARRQRCLEIREKLRKGEVHQVNEVITLNLDIWQFARDAIVNSEGPELLRAFYRVIAGHIPAKSNEKYERGLSVLDPTCGSGAFLFAALRILETLYSDCLERMRRFVDELEHSSEKHRPEKYADFKAVLAEIKDHPNERYFALKSIIINNLFGVDIMEEAVEICKLRLFLKLVAQVERVEQIEPLPDIDFNIRAGNTLVGYVSLDEVRRSQEGQLGFGDKELNRIEEDALVADGAYKRFREQQVRRGGTVTAKDKADLRKKLSKLDAELDRYLAGEYGVKLDKRNGFDAWKASHQPFHWLVEFFGIMRDGGFDVIIGNPPYVVYSTGKVDYSLLHNQFTTVATKNLYAFIFERSFSLSHARTSLGLIVQLTALSSERLESLQDLLTTRAGLIALSFPRRPESVFDGVEMPVCILLSTPSPVAVIHSSRVSRFYAQERPHALQVVSLAEHRIRRNRHRIAKLGTPLEVGIYAKLIRHKSTVSDLTRATSPYTLYYQEACRYWAKACVGAPYFKRNGVRISPPHGRTLSFASEEAVAFAACLLNSSLFYWFYSAFSDCEHINDALLQGFPIPAGWDKVSWTKQYRILATSLADNSVRKKISTKQGHTIEYDEMRALLSKALIDEIDLALGKFYGLDMTEVEFITSYDLKYRMGGTDDEETNEG